MIAEEVVQVSEIASHKGEAIVVHDVLFRILVLVKAEQTDGTVSLAKNLFRVSATSEGYIHIDAFRL